MSTKITYNRGSYICSRSKQSWKKENVSSVLNILLALVSKTTGWSRIAREIGNNWIHIDASGLKRSKFFENVRTSEEETKADKNRKKIILPLLTRHNFFAPSSRVPLRKTNVGKSRLMQINELDIELDWSPSPPCFRPLCQPTVALPLVQIKIRTQVIIGYKTAYLTKLVAPCKVKSVSNLWFWGVSRVFAVLSWLWGMFSPFLLGSCSGSTNNLCSGLAMSRLQMLFYLPKIEILWDWIPFLW